MSRHVFYSLHYDEDRTRCELVRNFKGLSANLEATPSAWSTLQRGGDFAIKRWLEQQLRGRSCAIVLIGAHTASRPWIQHEIKRAWELKLGLLGVHVHALNDARGKAGVMGKSPFEHADPAIRAAVRVYNPPETESKLAYRHIADNLEKWVEQAVVVRAALP